MVDTTGHGKPKPPKKSVRAHTYYSITSRQRQRMAEGRIESSPAEYGAGPSEDAASLREARRKIEERRWMKELGLLD